MTTLLAKAMTEAELQSNVTELCKVLGLLWYHTHDARRSPAGFPDLIIAGRRMIARELKTQREKPTPDQERWLAALRYAGIDADVWRPSDWLAGNVARQLQALRVRSQP